MEQKDFQAALERHESLIEGIRAAAHDLHASVNQTYGQGLPYSYHLDMVADNAMRYGHLVCAQESDVLPLLFGAYFHDSIEDARFSYNDVMKTAKGYMDEKQAYMATEIVYALTNEKGRNRDERAGEKYYAGIRATPYAPFTKMCDRLANIAFSCSGTDSYNHRMREVYRREEPHFLAAVDPHSPDIRFQVPQEMVDCMAELLAG